MGGGGHGLATACDWGRDHGATDAAVREKGGIGGGSTGRKTTTIRWNPLRDAPAAIDGKARPLYGTPSRDLNDNVMFSPRGALMPAQSHAGPAAARGSRLPR